MIATLGYTEKKNYRCGYGNDPIERYTNLSLAKDSCNANSQCKCIHCYNSNSNSNPKYCYTYYYRTITTITSNPYRDVWVSTPIQY